MSKPLSIGKIHLNITNESVTCISNENVSYKRKQKQNKTKYQRRKYNQP